MTNDTKRAERVENRPDNLVGSRPTDARHFDTTEDTFWRGRYAVEHYFVTGMTYDDYEPAYRYGYDMHHRYTGRKFDDVESDMARGWDKVKAKSRLGWEHAKHAVRAAWDRLENAVHDKDKEHRKHR